MTAQTWGTADFNGNAAPTALGGTTVTIGGLPAFIDYVSPGQVNAQVPSNISNGPQQVIVQTPGGISLAYTITVNAAEPGLLAPAVFDLNGQPYVAALYPNGTTYVLPTGAISGITSVPAQPGQTIVFYGVGMGVVTPNIPAGQIAAEANNLSGTFKIFFDGTPANVQFAGLVNGYLGLYQFNVVVPNVAAGNAVPVTFHVHSQRNARCTNSRDPHSELSRLGRQHSIHHGGRSRRRVTFRASIGLSCCHEADVAAWRRCCGRAGRSSSL